MLANTKSLVVLVAASVLAVQAQSGTETSSAAASTPSLSACLLQCVSTAAQSAGCSSFTDLACVCSSTSFQTTAGQCLQTSCTAEDVQTGLALQQQECGGLTTAGSGESTGTTTPASATPSGGSASATAPGHTTTTTSSKTSGTGASTSNAAAGLVPFAFDGLFGGTFIAFAGVLIGAALVL
ncbi:hypothetical protein SCLCIDRAFT_301368 [Scleroderma citrinum Foug A]|uniref:CFEM domain-containing protein n=1 Tax=Scleroderma citrinum Foug A TaxID=1036808 RepID=A0A0C3DH84_9AGAM|nr:hypothetical protein SCLCIDRAFT_301368 [Scleroderma citrinum Foug A]